MMASMPASTSGREPRRFMTVLLALMLTAVGATSASAQQVYPHAQFPGSRDGQVFILVTPGAPAMARFSGGTCLEIRWSGTAPVYLEVSHPGLLAWQGKAPPGWAVLPCPTPISTPSGNRQ